MPLWPYYVFQLLTFDYAEYLVPLRNPHSQGGHDILHHLLNVLREERKIYVVEQSWFVQKYVRYTIHHVPMVYVRCRQDDDDDDNKRTSQTSRSPSKFSIIFFSIGSVISQSWNAAVSFVSVCPSKMWEVLVVWLERSKNNKSHLLSVHVFFQCAQRATQCRSILTTSCYWWSSDWVIGIAKVKALIPGGKTNMCKFFFFHTYKS